MRLSTSPKNKEKKLNLQRYFYLPIFESSEKDKNGKKVYKTDKCFKKAVYFLKNSNHNLTLVHYIGDNEKYKGKIIFIKIYTV